MERNENGLPRNDSARQQSLGALDGFFGGNSSDSSNSESRRDGCRGDGGSMQKGSDLESMPLAYAYVPWQKWRMLYSPTEALANGTLFEELNKPLGVYGNE